MANDMQLAFADARRGLPDCRPTPVCDPRPVCPACGGLECLCRPRFFAGQLLTEEDLNRLDYYIVAKNRLHNRHLFGSGVVCGLEVVCSSCDPTGGGTVVVRPGYALSPCGNDIVVCNETPVNVCELINKCRPRAPDDCMQPGIAAGQCQGDEDWVLAICYQERQSRGITALRGASCSCGTCGGGTGSSGCSCGGSGSNTTSSASASCGCGGGTSAKTAKMQSAAKAGPTPAQCEPTLTCEGYTFAVYKKPPKNEKQQNYGALVNRFFCCLQPLLEQLVTPPANNPTVAQRKAWLHDLISMVREFLISEGFYDCELARRLEQVALPASDLPPRNYIVQWSTSTLAVLAIVATVFQKCLCAALLPPCPPAEMNDCVPIATVTVSRGKCRVLSVCNLAERRFALTFPTLEYWLSWLPMLTSWKAQTPAGKVAATPPPLTLREALKKLCCTPITEVFDFNADTVDLQTQQAKAQVNVHKMAATAPVASATAPTATIHPFTQLLMESFTGGTTTPNAATLLLGALGATTPNGGPLVSETAQQNPAAAMLVQGLLAPTLAPLLRGLGSAPTPQTENADTDALNARIEKLEARLKEQQVAIDKLSRA